jgi:hypothetical protein
MEITTTNTGLSVQQSSHPLLKPWVKQLPKKTLFDCVIAAVAKSYADLNFKEISDTDKFYLVNELVDNILKNFPAIRLEEISIAFANGIRGQYGEYMGLSVITFEKFISGYMLSRERAELVKSLPQPELSKEPDNLTKFELAKNNTIKAFQLKSDNKDYTLYALPVYDFLDKLKLIDFSTEEKLEFVNEARIALQIELNSEKEQEKDQFKRKDLNKTIEQIVTGQSQDLVIVKAKKLALNVFFESIILDNSDLIEMIEDRKKDFMKGLENG